ncbi:unnamed protein product [Natator depressus]
MFNLIHLAEYCKSHKILSTVDGKVQGTWKMKELTISLRYLLWLERQFNGRWKRQIHSSGPKIRTDSIILELAEISLSFPSTLDSMELEGSSNTAPRFRSDCIS